MRLLPLLLLCSVLYGDAIVSNTAGANTLGPDYWGQSFTTPSGSPWDNITFNFFSDVPAVTPEAVGTAWIYSEVPAPLFLSNIQNNFETNILAETSTIVNGKYVFPSSLVLQPNTQYFVFEDALMKVSGSTTTPGAGQTTWVAPYQPPPFGSVFSPFWSANFDVQGDPVGTPEPPPLAVVTLGIVLLAFSRHMIRRPVKF